MIAVVIALLLLAAAPAEAHTLTMRGAARVADRKADQISPARVELCRRATQHVVYCRAVFDRTHEGRRCTTVIRVRFPGSTRQVTSKIISIGCN